MVKFQLTSLLKDTLVFVDKKSPANAKRNTQQRCTFRSPVKQNLSSPILATMFLLHSPEAARQPAADYLWNSKFFLPLCHLAPSHGGTPF